MQASLYRRHRFPSEVISHCVWLPFRFNLSYRDVEEMMGVRGVALSYETVRDGTVYLTSWTNKLGQKDDGTLLSSIKAR